MEINKKEKETSESSKDLLPVSLLCGFLGAGKTTLLKHVLETKHQEKDFRCAVIVNDMAALNIDKALIDQSALVQSDEVIAMQNGCFCCTLQSDLVDQIISLTEKKIFNYMLIEASGVSEPSQIAPLFNLCEDEHDPDDPDADHDHDKPQLGEVARLDTCVTVVDSAEFHNNLGSMKVYEQGDTKGTIAELMMEQVEFSNVVILNKGDLVTEDQTVDIIEKITLLNPKAKVVKSIECQINVFDILNTGLYDVDKNKDEFWMTATEVAKEEEIEANILECCEKSLAKGGKKCCKSKGGNLVDSGLSQVQLDVVANNNMKERKVTRHESRFGITSFIYRARRPFHPGRLVDLFLEPFFCDMVDDDDEQEEVEEKGKISEEGKLNIQKEAAGKQVKRTGTMGELLRSKGFLWIATTHNIIGSWQQAGNVLRFGAESPWMCEIPWFWEGKPSEALVLKDMKQPSGEDYQYKDRRQEIVFIGQNIKHQVIQKILDQCLLNDEEMALGPEKWEETMAEFDTIQLTLEEDDDGEEEEDGEENEGENDSEEEGGENEGRGEMNDESEEIPRKKRKKSSKK